MSICGLVGRNKEQKDLVKTLMDDGVQLVIVDGGLGSGKTIVVTAYAIDQCKNRKFDQMLITRPMVPDRGEEIGYLPGTELEKLDPYLGCFHCAAEELHSAAEFKEFANPKSLATLKGTSFSHTVMMMDEAQDATRSQIKKFIGRAGRGSKVILMGDINQKSNEKNDGLDWLLDNLNKESHHFIRVCTLTECVRSEIASFADKLRP